MSYPGYPQQPHYPGAYPPQPGYPPQPVGYGAPMPGYPHAPQMGFAPQPFAAPAPMGGAGFHIVSRLNNLAIDVKGGNRNPVADVILWNKNDSNCRNQVFRFSPEGHIENVDTGLVFDIQGGGQPGQKIIMYGKKNAFDSRSNQLWRYDPSTEVFESHVPGLVLDIEGGNSAAGTNLIAWNRKGPHENTNQRFYLVPFGSGSYPPQPGYPMAPAPGYGAPVVPGYGAPVYGAPPGGDRPFCIRSRLSGKVLDVKGGDTNPGAHVIVWDHHGGGNQRWTMTPEGFIRNVATGHVLDILGGARQGNKIGVFNRKQPHEDSSNQRWRYDPSTETIISYAGGLVLDIEGGNSGSGAHVIAWTPNAPNANKNQRWTLEYC